ncbi:hypothetical protein BGZ63DRAFT_377219, partial [Mariannaea sp. PMI_226]
MLAPLLFLPWNLFCPTCFAPHLLSAQRERHESLTFSIAVSACVKGENMCVRLILEDLPILCCSFIVFSSTLVDMCTVKAFFF